MEVSKQLVDKIYEKRKAAALELEKYKVFLNWAPIPGSHILDRFENVISKEMTDVSRKLSTS